MKTKPGNTKYFATWVLSQLPALGIVWASREQISENPVSAGSAWVGWAALSAFCVKVWKEIEGDTVFAAAGLLRRVGRTSWRVLENAGDGLVSYFMGWSPGFTRTYKNEIHKAYGLFNDRGLGLINANRLDLDKVYVELAASAEVGSFEGQLLGKQLKNRFPIWQHFKALPPKSALVVVGAPGSGKTTLFQHILLTFARNRHRSKGQRKKVPIFVELRKIAVELQKPNTPSFPELMQLIIMQNLPRIGQRIPQGWIGRLLRRGQCILLFDGLDEVADLPLRKKLAIWIESQVRAFDWGRNTFLISSRPAGYRAASLDCGHVLEVQPFSPSDTIRFIEQWYLANEIVSHGNQHDSTVEYRAKRESEDLRKRLQENRNLTALTSNPLLLTMICMVHRYQGALPGTRGQLYGEICQVLVERWRQSKGLRDEFRGDQKLDVLREIAAHLMKSHTRELSIGEARDVASATLSLIGVDSARTEQFLGSLQESSGLILEREVGTWGFAHLSFQEYLNADLWEKRPERVPPDWSPMVSNSWWRESILLYASKARDASHIVISALERGSVDSLKLAFALLEERPNLQPLVRAQLEEHLEKALNAGAGSELFLPAAKAYLQKQYDSAYQEVEQGVEIGRPVTNAEFQLFLSSIPDDLLRFRCLPMHWTRDWFVGSPFAPITGASLIAAETFSGWLNECYPEWDHSLPLLSQFASHPSSEVNAVHCWLSDGTLASLVPDVSSATGHRAIANLPGNIFLQLRDNAIARASKEVSGSRFLRCSERIIRTVVGFSFDEMNDSGSDDSLGLFRKLALNHLLEASAAKTLERLLERSTEASVREAILIVKDEKNYVGERMNPQVQQLRDALLSLCDLLISKDSFVKREAYRSFISHILDALQSEERGVSRSIATLADALAEFKLRSKSPSRAKECIIVVRKSVS